MDSKPRKYWFKRRRFGYGWFPVSWQGWTLTIGFLVTTIALASIFSSEDEPWLFLIYMLPLLATFLIVTMKRSPKPKWRWGKKPDDNPDEDF